MGTSRQQLDVAVDGKTYRLVAIAEKRGIVAFECAAGTVAAIP